MTALLRLQSGGSSCTVIPALGGALLALELQGHPILRKAPDDCANVLETACFPMVPFGNRLVGGRVRAGRRLALPADPEAPPHALHGHGWRTQWVVVEAAADRVLLEFERAPDAWPWAYRATLEYALRARSLQITLGVANLSSAPMPYGCGIHPYFAIEPGSFIATDVTSCLIPDTQGVPRVPASWPPGRVSLAGLAPCDNFLLDSSGIMIVGNAQWTATIRAELVAGWQLYLPRESSFFCVEPVTHRPDHLENLIDATPDDRRHTARWRVVLELTEPAASGPHS